MRINLQTPKPYDGHALDYPVMMLPARIGTPVQAIVKTGIDFDDFIMWMTATPGRGPEVNNYAVSAVAEHLMAMANNMSKSVPSWMITRGDEPEVWDEGAIFDGVLLSRGKPVEEEELMDEWPVDCLQFVIFSAAPYSTGLLTGRDSYHLLLRRFVLQRALAIQHGGIDVGHDLFNHPVVISPYSVIHDDAQLGAEMQVIMESGSLNGAFVRHLEATWGHKKTTDWWHIIDDSELL